MLGHQLQLIGRLVFREDDTVTIVDNATRGRQCLDAYLIAFSELSVVTVLDELQPAETQQQHHRKRCDDDHREHEALFEQMLFAPEIFDAATEAHGVSAPAAREVTAQPLPCEGPKKRTRYDRQQTGPRAQGMAGPAVDDPDDDLPQQ